jgi:hypothetical protein
MNFRVNADVCDKLPMNDWRIEFLAGPLGLSVRSADLARIGGPHVSRRIAELRAHFEPVAGSADDVDPGSQPMVITRADEDGFSDRRRLGGLVDSRFGGSPRRRRGHRRGRVRCA